ncbi:MAG: glycine cleavage system aminomethyltransferase GcvT, partial [Nitrospira sp.]|nr:glycine cleavage system aminomethyltransferase GcvT [Nitrospira sp.]
LLQKGIGLGYVRSPYATPETGIMVDIRGKLVQAKIVKPPFYKRPSP